MVQIYFEVRNKAARGTDSVAADVVRHLHTRQHLGKAVIICDQPLAMLAASRKQWLKLSRAIQKQRASTLNADKILKYTHTITHMQHMQFTAKNPLEAPGAEVYFLQPADVRGALPVHCWTTYLLDDLTQEEAQALLSQLPAEALCVDYGHRQPWQQSLGLLPKKALEDRVDAEWQQVRRFMRSYNITLEDLVSDDIRNVEAMDDALDTLLGISHKFLQVANEFQRALELARPLRISKALRSQYDSLVLLAHRVQALSPGVFTQRFLETYNEDDTFFLYDVARGLMCGESLAESFARHTAAGRANLARALRIYHERLPRPAFV